MEVIETIKMVAELGFMIVASGIVLWQVYTHSNRTNKKEKQDSNIQNEERKLKNDRYEKMLDDIQNKQNTFIQMLIEEQKKQDNRCQSMVEKMIEIMREPHILTKEENNRMTQIDEEIDSFLERTLVVCNASRVSLIKYHNGGNDMLGNSILKMSMSNEKCAAGIVHMLNNFQNQLRSFSTYLMKELNEKGICFIEDVENIQMIDNSLYQYMKQIGVKAKYSIAINDTKNGTVIGYLNIDFANNEHINLEQVKHCLNDKKLKIETLLNLK